MSIVSEKLSFPELKNDLFIRAAYGEKVERVPVWIMRQAGRYLPEFRNLRTTHEFFKICETPELAAEVTLQPLARFDLDAAIIFNDILVIPKALGMDVKIGHKTGISISNRFEFPEDILQLNWPEPGCTTKGLDHVYKAITHTRHKLDGKVPLIGFTGGPWTLMCYMIEGGASSTMSNAKRWLYRYSVNSLTLLKKLVDVIVEYIIGQIEAGAQAVQVFESNAGYLGPELFNQFLRPHLKTITTHVRKHFAGKSIKLVPLILYLKGAHYSLNNLDDLGFDVISFDWTISPKLARSEIGNNVTLQGNLDPCALYGDLVSIRRETKNMLSDFGTHRYIANLGHGIYPDMDPAHVEVFINSVHEVSEAMIKEENEKYIQ